MIELQGRRSACERDCQSIIDHWKMRDHNIHTFVKNQLKIKCKKNLLRERNCQSIINISVIELPGRRSSCDCQYMI